MTVGQKRTRDSTPVVPHFPLPSEASASITPTAGGVPLYPRRSWGRRSASWTAAEDARLVELVAREMAIPPISHNAGQIKTWSRVAADLTNRTGKQCRERYINQLAPGIKRGPWSAEEERILHEAHRELGNKWVDIAKRLPGRTDNCVKNHWNSMLRKQLRRENAMRQVMDNAEAVRAFIMASAPMPHRDDSVVLQFADRRSELDHAMHAGSITPSGLSSFFNVPFPSGVPSPLAASSPITPKRDAKLQISSLVASDQDIGTEHPDVSVWNHSGNRVVQDGLFPPRDTVLEIPSYNNFVRSPNATNEPVSFSHHRPVSHDGIGDRDGQMYSGIPDVSGGSGSNGGHIGYDDGRTDGNVSRRIEFGNDVSLGHDVAVDVGQTHTAGMPSTTVDVGNNVIQNHNDGHGNHNSSPEAGETNDGDRSPKVRRLNEEIHDPLVALAMAASTIPRSPLTPEPVHSGSCQSMSGALGRRQLTQDGSNHAEAVAMNDEIWHTSGSDAE